MSTVVNSAVKEDRLVVAIEQARRDIKADVRELKGTMRSTRVWSGVMLVTVVLCIGAVVATLLTV